MEYCSQLNIEARFCSQESLIPLQATTLAPLQKPALHCKLQAEGEEKRRATHPYSGATSSGPLERHQQGDRNPESDTMGIIYPQNVRIFSYNREASTDRRPWT